ncbi:hypothetical protein C0J52_08098 [Blattella germanica]|nr:hypothetical protein C0J52_08098 [Blattella germanica]
MYFLEVLVKLTVGCASQHITYYTQSDFTLRCIVNEQQNVFLHHYLYLLNYLFNCKF